MTQYATPSVASADALALALLSRPDSDRILDSARALIVAFFGDRLDEAGETWTLATHDASELPGPRRLLTLYASVLEIAYLHEQVLADGTTLWWWGLNMTGDMLPRGTTDFLFEHDYTVVDDVVHLECDDDDFWPLVAELQIIHATRDLVARVIEECGPAPFFEEHSARLLRAALEHAPA